MTEIERISDQFRRAFDGNAWHGPSVMALLEGVTAAQAAARPIPSAHSIWQLVSHIAAWERACLRRLNGDPAKSIPLYEKALAIDPKHLGAHEYIGEAYLVLNDLPKAKEHLARLDRLCALSCEQYRDLKKAIQAYEKKAKPAAKN